MDCVRWVVRKELAGYFVTPIAPVFLLAFLLLSVCATFFWGHFFILDEASLRSYFYWLPFIFVAFVPAAGMRMWCEERRQRTLELLLTMPIQVWQAVLGKYLAGMAFLCLGLVLSFPLVVTVFHLGSPDIGPMVCGYLGSVLLSGVMLSMSGLLSALTSNQVISYVTSVMLCLFFVLGGHQSAMLFLRQWLHSDLAVSFIAWLGAGQRFETFQRGVIDAGDCVFLLSLTFLFLLGTAAALRQGRR